MGDLRGSTIPRCTHARVGATAAALWNTFLTPPCGAHRVFLMMARIVLSSDSDDVFERQPPRSRTAVVTNRRGRNIGDLDVDAAEMVPVVAATVVATETCLQVFYFSQKMLDFMCIHGTSERISQAYITQASDRKGVLLKRKESHTRTKNLRDWAAANEAKKPDGKELAELHRKRNRTNKNTDNVMGRNKDAEKRRRFAAELSQLSQTDDASQQNSQQQSQTDGSIGAKRLLHVLSTLSVIVNYMFTIYIFSGINLLFCDP